MSHFLMAYRRYLLYLDQNQRLVWATLAAFIVGLITLMLLTNVSITPDRLAVILFLAAAFMGQGVTFLRDWLPFLVLLMLYEGLRGFADFMPVHITDVIAVEQSLFAGAIPTIWLQERLLSATVSWLDMASTVIYFLHFPLPLCFAFWLWLTNRDWYWQFVTCLVLLCLSGFITYVIFPVMPPWLAAREGYIGPVSKIIDTVLELFPQQMSVSYLYHSLNPNQVAAIPSLHAAWPWLVLITLWRIKGRMAVIFLPYCLAVWFAIVYLGEHYVIDAVIGILYAQLCFWAGLRLYPGIKSRLMSWHRPSPQVPPLS